jgi:hypothetical protein
MMLGRLLYPLNKFDRWQVVLFIKGMAGSGKSCIAQMVQKWFCHEDVGIMSNNVQPQFALADLYTKKINICFEVKSDFKLNQAEFQSIVSGEDTAVNRKNKSVVMVQPWDIPLLLLGNESGNWVDAHGSVQRRIFNVGFDHVPANPDPNLTVELDEQCGLTMVKCNMAYRYYTELWGKHTDLWNRVPAYFRRQQAALKSQTDPVANYLQQIDDSVTDVRKGADVYMLFDDFCAKCQEFWRTHNIRTVSLSADTCASAFRIYGITTVNTTKDYNGSRVDGKYVMGIGNPDSIVDSSLSSGSILLT